MQSTVLSLLTSFGTDCVEYVEFNFKQITSFRGLISCAGAAVNVCRVPEAVRSTTEKSSSDWYFAVSAH